jgi:hypothetical protein
MSRPDVLVGFMGAGTSTVGELLAALKGTTFIDVDREIERRTSRSIPDLFSDGEEQFRELEEQVITELIAAGGFVIPEVAVDGPSLVALADLVVSAGGTMNREAVALGTPVLTTFEGKIGAVDEKLIADGRSTPGAPQRNDVEVVRYPRSEVAKRNAGAGEPK